MLLMCRSFLKTQHQDWGRVLEDTSACNALISGIHPTTFLSLERPRHTSQFHRIQKERKKKHISVNTLRLWFKILRPGVLMPHPDSGIWSAGSRSPSTSVRPLSILIHYVLSWNEQFNKVIPFICVSHAYSRASQAPTIQIFYRCLRGCSTLSEKKVFLIQAKRPSLSSPCLILWACVGLWRAQVGKYAL